MSQEIKPFNGHTRGEMFVGDPDGTMDTSAVGLRVNDEHGEPWVIADVHLTVSMDTRGESEGRDNAAMLKEAWNTYYPSRLLIEKLRGLIEKVQSNYNTAIDHDHFGRKFTANCIDALIAGVAEANAFLKP